MSIDKKKLISIVTPVYNEYQNIEELCSRIRETMAKTPYNYEHILIDNCSTDESVVLIKLLAAADPRIKAIVNARNFGYIRSSFHALINANGDAVILIASDLQDPPEIILQFIEKWESGFKTVLAVKPKSDESPFMNMIRKIYYKIVSRISEVPLVQNSTGSGLFDRLVVDILRSLKDPYPYFRGLVCEIGYPIATVEFHQPRRKRGITSQNFYSLYDMAVLGITKHSKIPLRIMVFVGFILSFLGSFFGLFYGILKLLFWNEFSIGIAPIVIGVLTFGSLQMFMLGLIGEYLISIQTHVRQLPHVVELERINFENRCE